MKEKVIREMRVTETEDGYRIEIKGEKEQLMQLGFMRRLLRGQGEHGGGRRRRGGRRRMRVRMMRGKHHGGDGQPFQSEPAESQVRHA